MKKTVAIIITISVLWVTLCGVLAYVFLFVDRVKSDHDIERYRILAEEQPALPDLDELGTYDDYYFKYYHKSMFIFQSNAYILKMLYDDENYEIQKEQLSERYTYQTELLDPDYRGEYKKLPRFQIDTFDIDVLSLQEYDLESYPKELIFVGTSDATNEIVYIYFYDQDLDYIDTSLEEFLREECGW